MTTVPIGERESSRLEFKGALALEKPQAIAREVVAMLNNEGGSVWVGIGEEDGYARKVEPIVEPDRAIDALQNHLSDTIEPSPRTAEVSLERVDVGGGHVVRLDVRPKRAPYALLRREGRAFFIRVGAHTRTMTREELSAAFGGDAKSRNEPASRSILEDARNAALARPNGSFWIAAASEPILRIEDLESFRSLLGDPTQSGNRRHGWTVCQSHGGVPENDPGSIAIRSGAHEIALSENGLLSFLAPLESLSHRKSRNDEGKELWPLALLEYPFSFLRVYSRLLEMVSSPVDRVYVDFTLVGLQGWILRPYSPGCAGFEDEIPGQEWRSYPDEQLYESVGLSATEVREAPDECGFQLMRRVYRAFGHDASAIPREFDRETRRLVIE